MLVRWLNDSSVRASLLIIVTGLATFSQALAAAPSVITTMHSLLFVSAATGLMYGTLFGLCPVLVYEWFGESSFSANWGWISLAPVLSGNVFNLLFGHVYDSHVSKHSHSHTCHKGPDCYRSVFVITSAGCFVSFVLAIVLVSRRVRRAKLWSSAALGHRSDVDR